MTLTDANLTLTPPPRRRRPFSAKKAAFTVPGRAALRPAVAYGQVKAEEMTE